MKIDFKALLQGLGQMGANTAAAYNGQPMQQFSAPVESVNKWWVKDKPKAGYLPNSAPMHENMHTGATEDTFGGGQTITRPLLGTAAETPLINNTDPQMMYRKRGNMMQGNPLGVVGNLLSNLGRGRRYGGDMEQGEPYVTGENGPEIVVPKKKGFVLSPEMIASALQQIGKQGGESPEGMTPPINGNVPNPYGGNDDPRMALQPVDTTQIDEQSRIYGGRRPEDVSTVDVTQTAPQMPMQSDAMPQQPNPLQKQLSNAERLYQDALAEDPKALNTGKHKFLKDALIKAAQIASNVFNPQNQIPVQGWGAARKALHVGKTGANLAPLVKLNDIQQQRALKDAQIDDVLNKPITRQNEIDRKAAWDAARAENFKEILKDKKKGRELQSTQIEDLRDYRKYLIENGTKMTDARIKQIDERLNDYDLDRASREKIAAANNSTRTGIAGEKLAFDKEKLDKTLQAADGKTKLTLVTQSLDKWKVANKRATPEQIAEAEAAIRKTVGLQ